jgi:crotonobetainyl-CoA:carnitine CoA-transferase CaiB-like acyl-CoA transferase
MIKQHTKQAVIDICDRADIRFAPIAQPERLFDDPQLNQRDYGLLETTFPNGKKTKMPRLPIQVGLYNFGKRMLPFVRTMGSPPCGVSSTTYEDYKRL